MRKIIGLVIGIVVMAALNGCSGTGGPAGNQCNTELVYKGYSEGTYQNSSGEYAASSVKLENKSDYTIEKVYTGINGDVEASSSYIPTDPGEYFVINSQYCGENEILRIIDDEGCSQEIAYFRGCDETALFEVVNNF